MNIRAFLAFDIPDDAKASLAQVIGDFREKEKGVKWIEPQNMHVTMKFFGSVEENLLIGDISEAIEKCVRGYGLSALSCQGIGVFPNWKYPRVIWAGFTGDVEKVINLQSRIEGSLSSFGFPEDKRQFRLHLTLGRAKGVLKKSPVVGIVEKLGPVKFGDVTVDRLVLYKSQLTKSGAVYTSLREFKL